MICVKCGKKYVAPRVEICKECLSNCGDNKNYSKELQELAERNSELSQGLDILKKNMEIALNNNAEVTEILKKIKKRLTTKNLRKGNTLDEISADLKYIHKLLGGIDWDNEEE